jgi:hypothetical protein
LGDVKKIALKVYKIKRLGFKSTKTREAVKNNDRSSFKRN